MKLDDIRKKIDNIDKDLVRIFEERMNLVKKVAQYKIENGKEIFDNSREEKVIEKALNNLNNKDMTEYTEEYFKCMMGVSRHMQRDLINKIKTKENIERNIKHNKVVFQGAEGSFSNIAAKQYFGEKQEMYAVDSFEEVLQKVITHEADCGVLPIENSITGSVVEVMDLIREYGCLIVGERIVEIKHCLLGVKETNMDNIKLAYSHPQALSQCRKYLDRKNIRKAFSPNTAVAVKYVKGQGDIKMAAIASEEAANIYGLKILDRNIQDNQNNYTRFLIIGPKTAEVNTFNKISIAFTVPNAPGALKQVLDDFAENNINLVKLESRPIWNCPWKYFFHMDISIESENMDVMKTLDDIEKRCENYIFLGKYMNHKML